MKQTFKMMLLVIFVLSFCYPIALAKTVDAPEHADEIYNSKTGKITVTIDADVIVPEADHIPIYSADTRFVTVEEVLALADAAFAEREYAGNTEFQQEHYAAGKESTFTEDHYVLYLESPEGYTLEGGNATIHELGVSGSSVRFDMPQTDGETVYHITDKVSMRFPDMPPKGCSLTYEEARQFADEVIAQFAPEHTCVGQAVKLGLISKDIRDEDFMESSPDEAWVLFYTRDLELPITYNIFGTESNFDMYAPVYNDDCITIIVDDNGVQALDYPNPHTITGVLQEDCELLPFDQIMEVAAAILPLKEVWLEQYYDDVRINIYEIRLGYMRVISRDTQKFEYIPVWDFFGIEECRETRDGEVCVSQEYPFYSYLTINAIDGTVIDRSYGY